MANSIPSSITRSIKRDIINRLETSDYLHQNRIQNGRLMDDLVSDPGIGGVLAQYMPKESVKTYIKDAIINPFSKNANYQLFTIEKIEKRLSNLEGCPVHCIEGKNSAKDLLFRSESGVIIAASKGTITKWETALRRVLEFIAKAKELPPLGVNMKIYILISSTGKQLTQSEIKHIEKTLRLISIGVVFFTD